MQQRLTSLVPTPWLFAHRGARAHEPENTLAAFRLALKLGATGLESDVWLTSDGEPVLDHDGIVGPRWKRRAIADTALRDLPVHIPHLGAVVDLATEHHVSLSLDIKDFAAFDAVCSALSAGAAGIRERTYVCVEDFHVLTEIAPKHRDLHLVDSSRLTKIKEGPERRLATLSEMGVVALNMHHSDWNGGLVTLAHRFERLAFGWDAQFDYALSSLLRMGIDGIYSDWVDRMVDAARREGVLL